MSTFVMDPERARLIQSGKMSAAGNLLAGIVHELNISVSNNRGCGATFSLDLPIVADAVGEDDDSCMDDPDVLAADRSVLIVDDEDYITELVESVLQKCGYRTDRLNDGG